MYERLKWIVTTKLLRRRSDIVAHWSSVVDSRTEFEGFNIIAERARIQNSRVGLFSYVNYETRLRDANIGRFSSIGPQCQIGGLGSHPTNRLSTHRMFYSNAYPIWSGFQAGPAHHERQLVEIGNDVWIGARVIILDGIKIGDGSIVASGAVVTADVEPYAVVGGVPAKLIRHRFDAEKRAELMCAKWWNQDTQTLKSMAQLGEFSQPLNSK